MKKLILITAFCLLSTISYAKEYNAFVTRVIDGDTIEVTLKLGFGIVLKDKVRFLDYDAPETHRVTKVTGPKSDWERYLGKEAKKFLTDKIEKQVIIIDVPENRERGKYGRILGTIYHNGDNINKLMVEKGFVK